MRRNARRIVGKIGQLVHHHVRTKAHHRVAQRARVIDVAEHWLGTERLDRRDLLRRAGHAGDRVSGLDEERHERSSNDAAGAC